MALPAYPDLKTHDSRAQLALKALSGGDLRDWRALLGSSILPHWAAFFYLASLVDSTI